MGRESWIRDIFDQGDKSSFHHLGSCLVSEFRWASQPKCHNCRNVIMSQLGRDTDPGVGKPPATGGYNTAAAPPLERYTFDKVKVKSQGSGVKSQIKVNSFHTTSSWIKIGGISRCLSVSPNHLELEIPMFAPPSWRIWRYKGARRWRHIA